MQELNCCKNVNLEYESGRSRTKATGKLCKPSPTRFVLRIREFLSIITRKRSSSSRRKTSSKGMDERKQHVHKTSSS